MTTPAERYAAARDRQARARSQLGAFAATLDFPLDDFQERACRAVETGRGVLVAAPTGAGKTVVGEFAVHLALERGQKAFYTTPIKALSNQKYHDLVARHGSASVGLLTGDSTVNGEAPVVVMTTEVLRNMMYAGSRTLEGLAFVVMDEVHYLADRFRGAVWEEVIIHLPESVQLVSLSATVSNAEEFGDWLTEVRGNHEVIVSEHRPVPLWQHMQVGRTVFDLFVEEGGRAPGGGASRVNPDLVAAIRSISGRSGRGEGRGRGRSGPPDRYRSRGGRRDARDRGGRPGGGATRTEVITRLERDGLLPAITFIFSRAGCEAAVGQLLAADVRLIPDTEGRRVRRVVEERIGVLADEDLSVLGYWDFVEGLTRGYAAHHAGMLPTFREIVEELFTDGRIRAVFATETLALGINMPARTVVIERLVKFNGEQHVDITPAEYTQLTGRAGRRGIDVEGHALVVWSRGLDPAVVAGLASTRTFPLRSSFRPTYNMAVNLVAQVGLDVAREVLETSFAQFQADRGVVGLATTVRRNEEAMRGYAEAMHCDRGDFREYADVRHRLSRLEKEGARERTASRRAEAALSLEALAPGDVIRIPSGRRAGLAVVVQPARGGRSDGPSVVTADRHLKRITVADVSEPVHPIARIKVPRSFSEKSPAARRDLASTLRNSVPDDPFPGGDGSGRSSSGAAAGARAAEGAAGEAERLRRELRAHPCHDCPDREAHARWSERWWRVRRETAGLQRRISNRTNSVARTFDRICDVLLELGYLDEGGSHVADEGQRLRRLYTEKDLLVAECLGSGLWARLTPPELAAVVSALVHEPRGEDTGAVARMPSEAVAETLRSMDGVWNDLVDLEQSHQLTPTGAPDGGLAWAVHRWAAGQPLEVVLRAEGLAAGDFVRRCKQVVDLLGQIADAAPDDALRSTAWAAAQGVLRGVVAADRLD